MQNAVIFDLDGLLIDSEVMFQQSRSLAAARLGYSLNKTFYFEHLAGHNLADSEGLLLELFGESFPFHDFSQICSEIVSTAIQSEEVPVKQGAIELLQWLQRSQFPCAIATGSRSGYVSRILEQLDFEQYFQEIVSRDDVREGKPAPELFLLAACRLGFAPSACIVLEDSDAGILSAKLAGMLSIMIPDRKPPNGRSMTYAHLVVENLHEAKTVLASLMYIPSALA